jgi:hypothetical protein
MTARHESCPADREPRFETEAGNSRSRVIKQWTQAGLRRHLRPNSHGCLQRRQPARLAAIACRSSRIAGKIGATWSDDIQAFEKGRVSMGVFFQKQGSGSPLMPILEAAYRQRPPSDTLLEDEVERFTSSFNPVQAALHTALTSETPADPNAAAQTAAQAAANAIAGSPTFQTRRFVGAMLIFLALLGTAIGCDASGLTTSTTALYSLVASLFGVIVGFLGGENGS